MHVQRHRPSSEGHGLRFVDCAVHPDGAGRWRAPIMAIRGMSLKSRHVSARRRRVERLYPNRYSGDDDSRASHRRAAVVLNQVRLCLGRTRYPDERLVPARPDRATICYARRRESIPATCRRSAETISPPSADRGLQRRTTHRGPGADMRIGAGAHIGRRGARTRAISLLATGLWVGAVGTHRHRATPTS